MNHKYGFHANRTGDDVFDAIRRIKPKVIKCLDPNVGFWSRVREIHPDVFLIGRLYDERQDFKDAPAQRGRDFAERILRLEAGQAAFAGKPLFNAWESYNEVIFNSTSPDEMRAYDQFQVAYGERLRAGGFEPIGMNFATGNLLGPDFLNCFRGTLDTYRYLGFHEYDWPEMWRLHEENIREKNEGGMWLTLRYRRIMNEVRKQYPGRHTVIITECGMTQGVQQRDDVGWRAEPAVPEEKYWESLQWYNSELMKDDYVMGACLFVVGAESAKWATFDHLGGIVNRLERFQASAAPAHVAVNFARPAGTIGVTVAPVGPKQPAFEMFAFGATEGGGEVASRTCRVGVHGRNHEEFRDRDFGVIREAGLEVVKMMSQTRPAVFERVKRENPNIEIITRLHDDRINAGGHPSPAEFAARMVPIMGALQPYCAKFQVANEPNHLQRYEGWGSNDDDARNFNSWFLDVYALLKQAHPWAKIGFPGLAIPDGAHRDRAWLNICRPAIQRADWLGVHCYWQTPPNGGSVMFDEAFGLTFKHYHQQYPNKVLEILECGNSNIQRPPGNAWPISDEAIAEEYVTWLREVFKYPYINSASFFILSSPDAANWSFFSWSTENDFVKPVVRRVKDMHRPAYRAASAGAPVAPKPPVKPVTPVTPPTKPIPVPAGTTNQIVINAFNRASLKLGMGNWGLLGLSGLSLNALISNRAAAYTGPGLDAMPRLTPEQRQVVRQQLPAGISFAVEQVEAGFLAQSEELALTALGLPPDQKVRLAGTHDAAERRVARVWNRFGVLLLKVADHLGLELPVTVAVTAVEASKRPGISGDGRLTIRFENHLFYDKWGRSHEELFGQHFATDPSRPWLGHQWRAEAGMAWRDVHLSQAEEWAAYECAAALDETAAQLSVAMGFAGIGGAPHAQLGYESAGQMFDAFASGERYQLLGYFDLIAGPDGNTRRVEALRRGDLETFATLHYGPGQAALYASILRQAVTAFERLNPTGASE